MHVARSCESQIFDKAQYDNIRHFHTSTECPETSDNPEPLICLDEGINPIQHEAWQAQLARASVHASAP